MIEKKHLIRGAKGNDPPPSPPQPTREPDTLHSRQYATFLDLVSEGEIEGFSTPSKNGLTDKTSTAYNNAALKDVFLNNTPVLNDTADNTNPASEDFNFQDVTFKKLKSYLGNQRNSIWFEKLSFMNQRMSFRNQRES